MEIKNVVIVVKLSFQKFYSDNSTISESVDFSQILSLLASKKVSYVICKTVLATNSCLPNGYFCNISSYSTKSAMKFWVVIPAQHAKYLSRSFDI